MSDPKPEQSVERTEDVLNEIIKAMVGHDELRYEKAVELLARRERTVAEAAARMMREAFAAWVAGEVPGDCKTPAEIAEAVCGKEEKSG